MHVQMGHRLASVLAVVDNDTKAFLQREFRRLLTGGQQQVAQKRLIVTRRLADAGDVPLRNDQEVHRSLRIDIVDNNALIILVLYFSWDFAVDDSLEECFHIVEDS